MRQITALYIAFAVLATGVNLLTQELVVRVYAGAFALYLAILAGTAAGLLSKYLLDKRYIFHHTTQSLEEDVGKFFAYTGTGIVTTLIFWGFELGFEAIIGNKTARYIGACIGLAIGYGIKYRLDKRYVFVQRRT